MEAALYSMQDQVAQMEKNNEVQRFCCSSIPIRTARVMEMQDLQDCQDLQKACLDLISANIS